MGRIYIGLRGSTSGHPQGWQLLVSGILKPGACCLLWIVPNPGKFLASIYTRVYFLGPKFHSIPESLALSMVNDTSEHPSVTVLRESVTGALDSVEEAAGDRVGNLQPHALARRKRADQD